MNIYISVVSHDHFGIIKKLGCLELLSEHFTVIVKNNNQEILPEGMLSKCIVINDNPNVGFAENNNYIFNYINDKFSPDKSDIFLVLNPDLYITAESVKLLCSEMVNYKSKFSTINLYRDFELNVMDNSVRQFPKFFDFVSSFIGIGNKTIIDKSLIQNPSPVDWCSGAFMAFTMEHYRDLKGFDTKFFMYCEDIDICNRSHGLGIPVIFHPKVNAVHVAQHANRKIFSRHFYWHVRSILIYLFTTK